MRKRVFARHFEIMVIISSEFIVANLQEVHWSARIRSSGSCICDVRQQDSCRRILEVLWLQPKKASGAFAEVTWRL